MHYYQFNIGDYAKSTKHLSPMEDLAYRRMLDLFYDSEKPLPCEIPAIARLIVMREYQEEIRQVLIEYWEETEHGWINKRANEDLTAYKEKSLKAKASAEARWAKQKESEPKANVMRSHNEGNANHKPLTINQEPETNKQLKSSRFTPPSLQDVVNYCRERNNGVNPQAFINHYESNGWMRGKTKIKDWKACVRTWEQNNPGQQQQAPKRNGFDTGFEK